MKEKSLSLDREKRNVLIEDLKAYMFEEMDVDMGDLKAELFLDFLEEAFGKAYFNNGVEEAKKYIFAKLEDLEIDSDQVLML